MKLFKCDCVLWTVREVEGYPYPGYDSEGEQCFKNTHFETADEAWAKLRRSAEARVCLSAEHVVDKREALAKAEREAADAAVAFVRVKEGMEEFEQGVEKDVKSA